MLMIRFQRIGRTNDPAFRIAVLEKQRAAQAGNILELLGTYNPKSKALTLNEEQVKHWLSMGAQPTDSIRNLLISKKVIEGKKVNVLPRKSPVKSEAVIAAEKAAAEAAKAAEVAAKAEAAAAEKAAAEAAAAPEAPTSEVGEPTKSVGFAEVEAPTEAEVVAEVEAEEAAEAAAPVAEEAAA